MHFVMQFHYMHTYLQVTIARLVLQISVRRQRLRPVTPSVIQYVQSTTFLVFVFVVNNNNNNIIIPFRLLIVF